MELGGCREKAMAPQSSTLSWKIPWTEEPGRLQSMLGSRRVRRDWATSLSLFTFMHWRRKWQPTPVYLPGESQGWGSLVGCRQGVTPRVGHDWSDLAVAGGCRERSKLYHSRSVADPTERDGTLVSPKGRWLPLNYPAGGRKNFSLPGNSPANKRLPQLSQWKASVLQTPSFFQWTPCL